MKANSIDLSHAYKGGYTITLELTEKPNIAHIEQLKAYCDNGKVIDVMIKKYRKKRSLDANATLWLYLSKIATILETTKDEIYLEMLKRYSHNFTHIVVKPEAVEEIKRQWKTVEEVGALEVNSKDGVQLRCYYGSSTMNSKEFSVLLNGVLLEAYELGCEKLCSKDVKALIDEMYNR